MTDEELIAVWQREGDRVAREVRQTSLVYGGAVVEFRDGAFHVHPPHELPPQTIVTHQVSSGRLVCQRLRIRAVDAAGE